MDTLQIFLIGVALSMDALAVSVTSGLALRRLRLVHVLKVGLFFGGFQALMPFIGWWAGTQAADYIRDYDHWVAFALLALIGGKMIYEALAPDRPAPAAGNAAQPARPLPPPAATGAAGDAGAAADGPDPLGFWPLLFLAIATSIDALAVGVTFSLLENGIDLPSALAIIGATTFAISAAGICLGHFFGNLFGHRLEVFGGLVLIGIGVKILWEHLS